MTNGEEIGDDLLPIDGNPKELTNFLIINFFDLKLLGAQKFTSDTHLLFIITNLGKDCFILEILGVFAKQCPFLFSSGTLSLLGYK